MLRPSHSGVRISILSSRAQRGILLGRKHLHVIAYISLVLEHQILSYIRQYSVLNFADALEPDAILLFADRISGSYNFVTALPVSRLILFLRSLGFPSNRHL